MFVYRHPQKTWKLIQTVSKGSAVVEFAFVAPLFFLILGGIVEFGQAFRVEHILSNACRRGARSAILPGATTSQVQASVRTQCESMLRVNGSDVTVTLKVNGMAANIDSAVKGDQIDVIVSIPYSKAGVGFFANLFTTAHLSSTCILEHE
jgi:Flp pilus assembly protein TadG